MGVSQGTKLGPLLLMLYVDDYSKVDCIISYADDAVEAVSWKTDRRA